MNCGRRPGSDQPIIIVGGGLAGLTAARLLHRAGAEFRLLEARDRLGGRILTVDAGGAPSDDGFDAGPSWFWPDLNRSMRDLVRTLGLAAFAQHAEGDIVFQRTAREPPKRYRGMRQEPQSMRLVGGMGAIVSALATGLPPSSIQHSARVTCVTRAKHGIELEYVDAASAKRRIGGSRVLLASPPRLLAATVAFSPALDASTVGRWREMPTWMAPHAKVFAIYERPFWRDAGLSGTAQSMVGPLAEIHDATTASGKAALFGFVGVPAPRRIAVGRDAIIRAAVQQLSALFGPAAAAPEGTILKDWAADPLTATADDQRAVDHPTADARAWVPDEWADHIALIGSETSHIDPGYLAGAVAAAERSVADILAGPSR